MASSVLTKGVPQIPDKVLPITDFAPDVDPITPGAMLNCTNLYPTWKGWRTYPSLVKFAGVTGIVGRLNGAGPRIAASIELINTVIAIPLIDFHTGADLPLIGSCPDDTIPTGNQSFELINCYDYNAGIPLGTLSGNCAGEMNFVQGTSATPEFIATVGNRDSNGTDYLTNTALVGGVTPMFQILHCVGAAITPVSPVAIPGISSSPTQPWVQIYTDEVHFGLEGKSDVMSYYVVGKYHSALLNTVTVAFFFDYQNNKPYLITNGSASADVFFGAWTKRGNRFWTAGLQEVFNTLPGITSWTLAEITGANPTWNDPLYVMHGPTFSDGTHTFSALQATDNFLWGFYRQSSSISTIYKMDWDGNVIATFPVVASGGGAPVQFCVVNDKTIYLWTELTATAYTLWYMDTSDGVFHPLNGTVNNFVVDGVINTACYYGSNSVKMQYSQLLFNNGNLFTGLGGTVSGVTGVAEIGTLVCPDTAIPL